EVERLEDGPIPVDEEVHRQPALVVQHVKAGARVEAAVVVDDELRDHAAQAIDRSIAAHEAPRAIASRHLSQSLRRRERIDLRRLVGAVHGVGADGRIIFPGDDLVADVEALPADDDAGSHGYSARNLIWVLPTRTRSPSWSSAGAEIRWLLTKVPLVEL